MTSLKQWVCYIIYILKINNIYEFHFIMNQGTGDRFLFSFVLFFNDPNLCLKQRVRKNIEHSLDIESKMKKTYYNIDVNNWGFC
jgi:hypothetical protein